MANELALITKYLDELDKVYKYMSKTSILDTPSSMLQKASDANSIKIAKIALQGLGDYDRNSGYVAGDVTLTWETHTFTQDRGRKFGVDGMDVLESLRNFGIVAGEFIRTLAIPEFDAYRMATYYANAGTTVQADTATGANVLLAIDAGQAVMDNAEVPEDGRILFISVAQYNLLKAAPTLYRRIGQGNDASFNRNFETFDNMRIQKMPTSRFYNGITQYDGATPGQEAGGYIKNGEDMNFLMVHPSAVIQLMKHNVSKTIAPEANQTSDQWMYFFRAYHDAWALENKTDGIYAHYKTT